MLYEMLTGRPPFLGEWLDVLEAFRPDGRRPLADVPQDQAVKLTVWDGGPAD